MIVSLLSEASTGTIPHSSLRMIFTASATLCDGSTVPGFLVIISDAFIGRFLVFVNDRCCDSCNIGASGKVPDCGEMSRGGPMFRFEAVD
jgi:hypothetical protein